MGFGALSLSYYRTGCDCHQCIRYLLVIVFHPVIRQSSLSSRYHPVACIHVRRCSTYFWDERIFDTRLPFTACDGTIAGRETPVVSTLEMSTTTYDRCLIAISTQSYRVLRSSERLDHSTGTLPRPAKGALELASVAVTQTHTPPKHYGMPVHRHHPRCPQVSKAAAFLPCCWVAMG